MRPTAGGEFCENERKIRRRKFLDKDRISGVFILGKSGDRNKEILKKVCFVKLFLGHIFLKNKYSCDTILKI